MLDQQLETGGHVVVWTLQRQISLLSSSRQGPPLDLPLDPKAKHPSSPEQPSNILLHSLTGADAISHDTLQGHSDGGRDPCR
jgi:hypothetical protein